MDKRVALLINQKTASDVTLIGYMMFLNEKGLLKEAMEFVEGFVKSLTKEEFIALTQKYANTLEHSSTDAKK